MELEANDASTGSTEWRYDTASGQYVFNLSTKNGGTNPTFFQNGAGYQVAVGYRDPSLADGPVGYVVVAKGKFTLK